MTPRPPPHSLLHTFEVAARHLSFKKAAIELHVTPAAISQQIRTLEERLGGPLFHRRTRALSLSERGAAMLPKVREGFECLEMAIRRGHDSSASAHHSVRLIAPPSFASHWLLPRLPRFYAAHPGIDVQLSSSATTVDRPGDERALDRLQGTHADSAGTLVVLYGSGKPDAARFAVDRLMTPEYLPVCSPTLASQAQPLAVPADLLHQVLLHDATVTDPTSRSTWGWPQWLAAAGVADVPATGGRHFSNTVLALEAALAGQGVALASLPLVVAHLANGTLVAPFTTSVRSPFSYDLVGERGEADRVDVQRLRRWLVDEAAAASPAIPGAADPAVPP